jgi:hypothetical protein
MKFEIGKPQSSDFRSDRIEPPIDILITAIDWWILWINDFPCADIATVHGYQAAHFNTP